MIPVKICGITRVEDAVLAVELGAAAIGFVFYEKSPRCIEARMAQKIGSHVPEHVARVGVFVNPTLALLREIAASANLTHVQLHGEEALELCAHAPLPVIKAIRNENEFAQYRAVAVSAFLIDSRTREHAGGTGLLSDWSLCEHVREHAPVMLAGGLSAENVTQAVAATQPDALDLSSSVEHAPGVKDHEKLRRFFAALAELKFERTSRKIF
jgi:phosphoribosylanthranilate isomerase